MASGSVNWYNLFGSNVVISIKSQRHVPFGPTIPFPGIYLTVTFLHMQNDLCPKLFIQALYAIAKYWNQPRWMTTWIRYRLNKLWYSHKMEYHTVLKRYEEILKELIWEVLQDKILRGKSKVQNTGNTVSSFFKVRRWKTIFIPVCTCFNNTS